MHNISFKSYTNVVSARDIRIGDLQTSYLAMKLDDNGENDLTKLREIRKMRNYPDKFPNDDILTIINIADRNTENLYLSRKCMCWGEQLKIIEENCIPQIISRGEYNMLERAHLKAYTLIASLTKRMMNDKFENEDQDIKRVIKTLYDNIRMIPENIRYKLFSEYEAAEMTMIGCLKHTKFQPVAEEFNKKIAKNMANFFK